MVRRDRKWQRAMRWSTVTTVPIYMMLYLDQGARSWWRESIVVRTCPSRRGTGSLGTLRGTLWAPRRAGNSTPGRARDRSPAAARRASPPRTPRPRPRSPPPWRARPATICSARCTPATTPEADRLASICPLVLYHYDTYAQCLRRKVTNELNWQTILHSAKTNIYSDVIPVKSRQSCRPLTWGCNGTRLTG